MISHFRGNLFQLVSASGSQKKKKAQNSEKGDKILKSLTLKLSTIRMRNNNGAESQQTKYL